MDQNLIKHIVPTLTLDKQNCMNSHYGKCKRKVSTGFCWQHYPEIRAYGDPTEIKLCIRKLLNLSRLARVADRTAKISIVQALFEVVSINKWYLRSNPEFYQNLVNKYRVFKERCELARYSYLEQPLHQQYSHVADSKWSNSVHYWAFPKSKRKPKPPDTCYAFSAPLTEADHGRPSSRFTARGEAASAQTGLWQQTASAYF